MTASHPTPVAVVETSLPRVREYLDRVVAEAIREAAEAVRLVDQVRAYLDRLEAEVGGCAERMDVGQCPPCAGRLTVARELRALLPEVKS